jgi:hypothetical protein
VKKINKEKGNVLAFESSLAPDGAGLRAAAEVERDAFPGGGRRQITFLYEKPTRGLSPLKEKSFKECPLFYSYLRKGGDTIGTKRKRNDKQFCFSFFRKTR